jgi:hypothetical protein
LAYQLVTRHHRSVGACEGHQHLHHPRLETFPHAARLNFAQRRPHENVAELKIVFAGEAGRTNRLEQGWTLVHCAIIRLLGKSSAIHQARVLSNPVATGCNRATNWRVPVRQAGAEKTV